MSRFQDLMFWAKNYLRPEAMRQYKQALAMEKLRGGK